MDAYLTGFRKQMDMPEKSGVMLDLEDARWHLSAVLNYSYANAIPHHKYFQVDTFYTVFPLSNMMVSMDDINDAFVTFTTDLVNTYQAIPHDDKTLVIVVTQVAGQNGHEAQIRMISTFAYSPGISVYQFDETDWWYWGEESGKCGLFIGEGIGSDAAIELTAKANLSLTVPIGRIYYTDEIPVTIMAYDYEISWQDHPYGRHSLIFWQVGIQSQPPPEWSCLCPDEMNYYLSNIRDIIVLDNPPDPDMTLCNYYIESLLIPGYNVDWQHRLTLTYGIQHVTATMPEL